MPGRYDTVAVTLHWIFVVGIHVAAALRHGVIDRDGLLRRMWFARSSA
jgi:cytochrome b561